MRTDNYRPLHGRDDWDQDGDGEWSGFVPDCFYAFHDEGFDRNPAGEPTGWRGYASTPFPGAFWPTNGAFGAWWRARSDLPGSGGARDAVMSCLSDITCELGARCGGGDR